MCSSSPTCSPSLNLSQACKAQLNSVCPWPGADVTTGKGGRIAFPSAPRSHNDHKHAPGWELSCPPVPVFSPADQTLGHRFNEWTFGDTKGFLFSTFEAHAAAQGPQVMLLE